MIVQRTLAVLAAILLVGAVALATLGPDTISLGRALFDLSPGQPEAVHRWLERFMGGWAWDDLALPLMIRPAWLLPASLGLICVGMAVTASTRKSTHRSHRRS